MIQKVNNFKIFKNKFSEVGRNTNEVIQYIQSLVNKNHYMFPQADIFQRKLSVDKNALYRNFESDENKASQFISVGLDSVVTIARNLCKSTSGTELTVCKYMGRISKGLEKSKCVKITNIYKNCANGKIDEISKRYFNNDCGDILIIYSKQNRVSKFPSTTLAKSFMERFSDVVPDKNAKGDLVYTVFLGK